jgi:DNA-binding PadR family transcriptional regulator
VSPIFRHGRLRLYLLKLLDEAPRHGYEVIRLLQDRFMGVYSPSPGTIYPRLARLEEDGLVTHDEVEGRKVYRITDKGREEIQARLDDLAELEEELTESVRDIAREVSEDVRDTVRSLREEITWAARDFRREGDPARRRRGGEGPDDADRREDAASHEDQPGTDQGSIDQRGTDQRGTDADAADAGAPGTDRLGSDEQATGERGTDERGTDDRDERRGAGRSDDAARIRDEARRARDEIRDTFRAQRRGAGRSASATGQGGRDQAGRDQGSRDPSGPGRGETGSGRGRADQGGRRAGANRGSGFGDDWGGWADKAAGWQAWSDRSERRGPGGRPGGGRGGGWGGWQDLAGGMPGGLERLASDFARELRSAAGHADDIREGALGDLRDILADTLARIRDEVFTGDPHTDAEPADESPADHTAADDTGTSDTRAGGAATDTRQRKPSESKAAPAGDRPGDTPADDSPAQ